MFQAVIIAKNCCGRGVRYRQLDPFEHDQVLTDAAKVVGPEATMIELRKQELSMGTRRMICAVTKSGGYAKPDDVLALPETEWKKMSQKDLDEDFTKLFNAKDYNVLRRIYMELHEVSDDDVLAISGKALTVSED